MKKKTQIEYVREWESARKKEGWLRINLFLPGQLIAEIKELIRKWKYEHPNFWRNL
jgi:hypothetical protein